MANVQRFCAADDFSGEECVYAKDYDRLLAEKQDLITDAELYRVLMKTGTDDAFVDALNPIIDPWFKTWEGRDAFENDDEAAIREFHTKVRDEAIKLGLWEKLK